MNTVIKEKTVTEKQKVVKTYSSIYELFRNWIVNKIIFKKYYWEVVKK